MRLIDSTRLILESDGESVSLRDIVNAPTVDAEPVVRCRDCKYRGFSECTMCHEELHDYYDDGYLESDVRVYDYTEDDGFCHKGERRKVSGYGMDFSK